MAQRSGNATPFCVHMALLLIPAWEAHCVYNAAGYRLYGLEWHITAVCSLLRKVHSFLAL